MAIGNRPTGTIRIDDRIQSDVCKRCRKRHTAHKSGLCYQCRKIAK